MDAWIDPTALTFYRGDRAHYNHIPAASEPKHPDQIPVLDGDVHIGWEELPSVPNPDKLFALMISPEAGGPLYYQLVNANSSAITVLGQTLSNTYKNPSISDAAKFGSLQSAISLLVNELQRLGLRTAATDQLLRGLLDESGYEAIAIPDSG